MSRGLFVLLLVTGLAACSGPAITPGAFSDIAEPGPIAPLEQMPDAFMLRQTVTASWGEDGDAQSFEAVVQQVDGVLTIVALSPTGQPGFVVRYDGADFSMENHTERELPFPPEFMVGDVQRVFYPWPDERYGEVLVTEEGPGSRPTRRLFTRTSETGDETLIVALAEWGEIVPARASLESWYGYTLTIETYEQTRLD